MHVYSFGNSKTRFVLEKTKKAFKKVNCPVGIVDQNQPVGYQSHDAFKSHPLCLTP